MRINDKSLIKEITKKEKKAKVRPSEDHPWRGWKRKNVTFQSSNKV
ncbi:MAG: hypothetical protein LDL13_05795 [Calditerrivibrio sp.]|nr:hypothetical protein [Calditerrivibrio sp.]MCA1979991.1 hypothetical protein [Calditerrivibrio sp.]